MASRGRGKRPARTRSVKGTPRGTRVLEVLDIERLVRGEYKPNQYVQLSNGRIIQAIPSNAGLIREDVRVSRRWPRMITGP